MPKKATFNWSADCQTAFANLKHQLSTASILSFPQFDSNADNLSLHTDASSVGLGAVLEQSGKVIVYASRSLTPAERQYSTIQKECLAIVYATKQFRYYLLGCHFNLFTDHASLQQKMEGLLCRWALCVQEYDYSITYVYQKGTQNQSADALSRLDTKVPESYPISTTTLQPSPFLAQLKEAQMKDEHIQQLHSLLASSQTTFKGRHWRRYPLQRY